MENKIVNELFDGLPSGETGTLPKPYAERLKRLEAWTYLNLIGLVSLAVSVFALMLRV
jgi:hypothetical protein